MLGNGHELIILGYSHSGLIHSNRGTRRIYENSIKDFMR
jgi:hypothetical protein